MRNANQSKPDATAMPSQNRIDRVVHAAIIQTALFHFTGEGIP